MFFLQISDEELAWTLNKVNIVFLEYCCFRNVFFWLKEFFLLLLLLNCYIFASYQERLKQICLNDPNIKLKLNYSRSKTCRVLHSNQWVLIIIMVLMCASIQLMFQNLNWVQEYMNIRDNLYLLYLYLRARKTDLIGYVGEK